MFEFEPFFSFEQLYCEKLDTSTYLLVVCLLYINVQYLYRVSNHRLDLLEPVQLLSEFGTVGAFNIFLQNLHAYLEFQQQKVENHCH